MAGSALNFGSSADITRVDNRVSNETVLRIENDKTIYVSLTGNDVTGDGTTDLPFATVTRAFTSLKNYSISSGVSVKIHIKAGFYEIDETFFPRVDDFDPQYGITAGNVLKSGSGYLGTAVHPDIDRIVITGDEPKERRFINMTGNGLSGGSSYEYEIESSTVTGVNTFEFGNHKMSCVVDLLNGESITDLAAGISYASIYCNHGSVKCAGPSSTNREGVNVVGSYKTFFQGGPKNGRGWGINPADEGLSGSVEGGSAAYPYYLDADGVGYMTNTSTGNLGETPRSLARFYILGCHEIAGVSATTSGASGFGLNLNNNNHIVTKDNYAVSSELAYNSCSGEKAFGDWCPNTYMDDYDHNENIFAATLRGFSGAGGATAIACGHNTTEGSTGTVLPSSSVIFDLNAGLTVSGGPFLSDPNLRARFHGTVIRRKKSTWTYNSTESNPTFSATQFQCLLYIDGCSVSLRNLCLVSDNTHYPNDKQYFKTCICILNGGTLVPEKLSIREFHIGITLHGQNSTLTVTGRHAHDEPTGTLARGQGDLIISKCSRGIDADVDAGNITLHDSYITGSHWMALRAIGTKMLSYKLWTIGSALYSHYFVDSSVMESNCYNLWSNQYPGYSTESCGIQKWGPGVDDFPGYSDNYSGIDYDDERNWEKTWRLRTPYPGTAIWFVRGTKGLITDSITGWAGKGISVNHGSTCYQQRSLTFNTYTGFARVADNSNLYLVNNAWYINFWVGSFYCTQGSRMSSIYETVRGTQRHRQAYWGIGTWTINRNSSARIHNVICDETIGLSNPYVDGNNHTGSSGVTKQSVTSTIGALGWAGLGLYVHEDSSASVRNFGSFYLPRKYDFYVRQRGNIQANYVARFAGWNHNPNPDACEGLGLSGAQANRLNRIAFLEDGNGSIQGKYTGNTRADLSDVPSWDATDDIEKNRAYAFGDGSGPSVTTIPHFGGYWEGELTPREVGVAGQTGNTGGFVWMQD